MDWIQVSRQVAAGVILLVFVRWFFFTGWTQSPPSVERLLGGLAVQPELAQHSNEFNVPTVVKVTEGVYVAVGFALANSILIEGPEGLIIVDTTENVSVGKRILSEFRKISPQKPITDIVFTHNHGDHSYGTQGFIEDADNPPNIWAYHTYSELVLGTYTVGTKLRRGADHQIGVHLGPEYHVNNGLGPKAVFNFTVASVAPEPTRLIYGETEEAKLAGRFVTFIHIPGETDDQMAVWLQDQRVLLPADDIYKTFPNLYAIRGTPPRNAMTWHRSLKKMRSLNAEFLVPSHTQPLIGADVIHEVLTSYMAGIQYVHDQTVRRINDGLHPDEIASQIDRLPPSLASHPFLQQFYGTTVWSAKGIYENYIGWFSGDPVELLPLAPAERSRRLVGLIGTDKMLQEAEAALDRGDLQWSLELVSHVFRIRPDDMVARELRLGVLRQLASSQSNPLARNFYMTTILNDHGLIDWKLDKTAIIQTIPIRNLLNLMRYRLKAEEVGKVNLTVVIRFTDIQETYRLQIVHSILDVDEIAVRNTKQEEKEEEVEEEEEEEGEGHIDAKVVTSSQTWRDILSKRRSPLMALAQGELKVVRGGIMRLREFFSYFQAEQ